MADLVDGLIRLSVSDERFPVNLGNPVGVDDSGVRGKNPAADGVEFRDDFRAAAGGRSAETAPGYCEGETSAGVGAEGFAGGGVEGYGGVFPGVGASGDRWVNGRRVADSLRRGGDCRADARFRAWRCSFRRGLCTGLAARVGYPAPPTAASWIAARRRDESRRGKHECLRHKRVARALLRAVSTLVSRPAEILSMLPALRSRDRTPPTASASLSRGRAVVRYMAPARQRAGLAPASGWAAQRRRSICLGRPAPGFDAVGSNVPSTNGGRSDCGLLNSQRCEAGSLRAWRLGDYAEPCSSSDPASGWT